VQAVSVSFITIMTLMLSKNMAMLMMKACDKRTMFCYKFLFFFCAQKDLMLMPCLTLASGWTVVRQPSTEAKSC